MLEGVFGNITAEKVLFHVFHYGAIHASAIAKDYSTSVTPILNQLDRFESAGILISKQIGRSRTYSFNLKSPLTKPIMDLIQISYECIPLDERVKLFISRRRPRRKGKDVL